MPELEKIDHIHVYVPNRLDAEHWYQEVLGFTRIESLASWFTDGGPLAIENGGVHIALFEGQSAVTTTVAFSVDAANYLAWKVNLDSHGINYKESDHDLSWSIYFKDPYDHPYEITSYDYQDIRKALQ
tara:strand:- start:1121 stop:1504 length:384 start_codon:yes stop_codon:yes gene_type:complete